MSSPRTAPGGVSPRSAPDFSGLWVPLITPFKLNVQEVDHPALAQMVERLVKDGVDGFVVCGTTGEAAALSESEQLACLRTVAAHAHGRPLIMGVGGEQWASTREWMVRISTASQDGNLPAIAGVLLTAPHYVRPSSAGLHQWFTSLADASAVPVLIYDIPYRTGAALSRELLLDLAGHPNIAAIKDCGGDPGKTLALLCDGRLQVLAGEDLAIFSTLAQGGSGAIAASLHVGTAQFVAMVHALGAGELATARDVWQGLVPLIEALYTEPNPGPLKALLSMQGQCHADMRSPMFAVSASTRKRLEGFVSLR